MMLYISFSTVTCYSNFLKTHINFVVIHLHLQKYEHGRSRCQTNRNHMHISIMLESVEFSFNIYYCNDAAITMIYIFFLCFLIQHLLATQIHILLIKVFFCFSLIIKHFYSTSINDAFSFLLLL